MIDPNTISKKVKDLQSRSASLPITGVRDSFLSSLFTFHLADDTVHLKTQPILSFLFVLLLLVPSQTGCISLAALMGMQRKTSGLDTRLLEAQGYSLPPGGMPTAVKPDESGRPRVVLEVRDKNDKRHIESIPLSTDNPLFVQDLVKQAQLHDHFGSLYISIMRPSTGGAPPIRLKVHTDDDGNTTSLGANYALLPGDHLIVTEDNQSALTKFVKSQFGG